MADFYTERVREFYAETYDTVVPDWPGEIDFYCELAAETHSSRTSRPLERELAGGAN